MGYKYFHKERAERAERDEKLRLTFAGIGMAEDRLGVQRLSYAWKVKGDPERMFVTPVAEFWR